MSEMIEFSVDQLRLIAEALSYQVVGEGDGVIRFAPDPSYGDSRGEFVAFPEHRGFVDQADVARAFIESGVSAERLMQAVNQVLSTENAA